MKSLPSSRKHNACHANFRCRKPLGSHISLPAQLDVTRKGESELSPAELHTEILSVEVKIVARNDVWGIYNRRRINDCWPIDRHSIGDRRRGDVRSMEPGVMMVVPMRMACACNADSTQNSQYGQNGK